MINNEPAGLKPNLSANSDKKEDAPAISDVTDKAIDPSKDVNNEVPNQELSSHVSDHSQSDSVVPGAKEDAGEIGEPSNEDGALLRNAENADEKPRNDVEEEVSNDQAHVSGHSIVYDICLTIFLGVYYGAVAIAFEIIPHIMMVALLAGLLTDEMMRRKQMDNQTRCQIPGLRLWYSWP